MIDAALTEMAGFSISLGWTIDALRDPIEIVTTFKTWFFVFKNAALKCSLS